MGFAGVFGLIACVFYVLASPICLAADNSPVIPTLKVYASGDKEEPKLVNWTYKIKPMWVNSADSGVQFYWALELPIESGADIASVQAEKATLGIWDPPVKRAFSGKTLHLGLNSLKDRVLVNLRDGSRMLIKTELNFTKSQVNEQNCEEHNLRLVPQDSLSLAEAEKNAQAFNQAEEIGKGKGASGSPANTSANDASQPATADASANPKAKTQADPGVTTGKNPLSKKRLPSYLFYRCEVSNNGIVLGVTVPSETSWASTTVFESKGKGKNWRDFEINPQLATSGLNEVGELTFEVDGRLYPFKIILDKTEIVRPIATFRFSLGFANLSLTANSGSDSTVKPASYVSFELRPFNPKLSIGGQGLTSLPQLGSNSFFSHVETLGYLGYVVKSTARWFLEPRLYFYLADGVSENTNYYYVGSSPAIGGLAKWAWDSRNELSGELVFMSLGKESIESLRLFYTNKNRNQVGGWGVALITQKVGMNLGGASAAHASQMYLGPYLEF